MNNLSQRTGVRTFASRLSPSTDQSLQTSFHLSSPDNIELKKISFPSENKKYATAQSNTTKATKRSIVNGLQGRRTEGQLVDLRKNRTIQKLTIKLVTFKCMI
ncbi:MAG: hypothetical protein IPL63_05995 [Saprospiraceae bacterium]|nr:hypothetical protein [Saprospiraceae bacterium]